MAPSKRGKVGASSQAEPSSSLSSPMRKLRSSQSTKAADPSSSVTTTSTTSSSSSSSHTMKYPVTPDGHYFIVRGRLWRCTNPALAPSHRSELQKELMSARRAMSARSRAKSSAEDVQRAKEKVQDAKVALGERGPPWWEEKKGEGGQVVDRKMVWNSPYKSWWDGLSSDEKGET